MSNNCLKKIALVGASGNVGSSTLKHLLATQQFHITIISRTDSKASFPSDSSITIKRGSYADSNFLLDAFKDQDAAIFSLSFMATNEQSKLIEAAAKAGVKWILPNEYAGDGMNENMSQGVPLFHPKTAARRQIEELSKTHDGLKWIGISTGPWTEFSIQRGLFGINIINKTATVYPDSGPFNTSTLNQVGLGISKLLSLPLSDPSSPRASLQHYANNFVYISSFSVTQQQLFDSVVRVTGTKESDWTVDRESTMKAMIENCREKMAKGDMMAGAGLTYAFYMGQGLGGDVESRSKEDRKVLALEVEDLDTVVKRAVEAGSAPKQF